MLLPVKARPAGVAEATGVAGSAAALPLADGAGSPAPAVVELLPPVAGAVVVELVVVDVVAAVAVPAPEVSGRVGLGRRR